MSPTVTRPSASDQAHTRLLVRALRLVLHEADRTSRLQLLAGMALVVVGALLAALAPLVLKTLVDTLAATPPASEAHQNAPIAVLGLAGLYLLALGSMRLLAELRPLLSGSAEQAIAARLSQRFFAHALALPMAFHRAGHSGALGQTLRQATAGCQMLLSTLVNSIAPVLVEVVAVMALLAHIDQPALVACFAITALAYLGVCGTGALQLQKRARAVSDAGLRSQALLADSLGQVEAIKCFSAEPTARARFAATVTDLQGRWLQLYRQRARTGLLLALIFTASLGVSLAIATRAYAQGALSIGGFVLVTVYLLQLMRPLEILGGAARELAQALEFIRPLLDLLQRPMEGETPEPVRQVAGPTLSRGQSEPQAPKPSRGPAITLRQVHLAYDTGPPVLRGLDLAIDSGRSLAIVGASGSGKTSIARLLLRLVEPTSGQVLFDGQPVSSLPLTTLRAGVSLVPQDVSLMDSSIADNIGLADPEASRAMIESAAQQAQLHAFVMSLPKGYDTRVGERGLVLSGGERQRVAIARLLLKPAPLCILDEATSMLDPATEAAVMAAVAYACQGSTLLLIAHRLSSLRWADEIAVVDQGRVVERGVHDQLLRAAGPYARLWRAQEGTARAGHTTTHVHAATHRYS